jgi:predicted O-methyltransferase YrrM
VASLRVPTAFGNRVLSLVKGELLGRVFERLIEARLKRAEHPMAPAIVRATRRQFHPQEAEALAVVEKLQRQYLQSTRQIEMVYYGVGGPTKRLSPEAVRQGVTVRETVGRGVSRISSPPWKGRILFSVIRRHGPDTVLELGTGYGISGLYQLAALKMNTAGHFYTIDGSPDNLAIAEEMFHTLASTGWKTCLGPLHDILPGVLEQVASVNMVFIDADHSYDGMLRSFNAILPYLTSGGIMIFDDIRWSRGAYRAWRDITRHPAMCHPIDLYALGICIKT